MAHTAEHVKARQVRRGKHLLRNIFCEQPWLKCGAKGCHSRARRYAGEKSYCNICYQRLVYKLVQRLREKAARLRERYHSDPEFRRKRIEGASEYKRRRMALDEEYRVRIRVQHRESERRLYHSNAAYREMKLASARRLKADPQKRQAYLAHDREKYRSDPEYAKRRKEYAKEYEKRRAAEDPEYAERRRQQRNENKRKWREANKEKERERQRESYLRRKALKAGGEVAGSLPAPVPVSG